MTYSGTFITKTLSAIVITCALAAVHAVPAAAQVATELDCDSCIKSSHIEDGKIKGKDLQDGAVNNDKIEDEAVNSAKIEDSSVDNIDLSGDAVTSDKIADGEVDTPDLAGGAVTRGKIDNGAVNSAKVQNNSLTGLDIANEAGADFDGANGSVGLAGVVVTVRSVGITAPTSGFVIVNASGYFFSTQNSIGRCSITTGSVIDTDALAVGEVDGAVDSFDPLGMTRGFAVSAGSTTFNLVCEGTVGDMDLIDSQMTAMFFPTQY